jgi:transposase
MFCAYVREVLVPSLRQGDVVVLDNLSSHKHPDVEVMIAKAGASLLFLPPYSPDFNPIEQLFAKLKSLTRAAAKRTINELWGFIGTIFDRFSPAECANYLSNCGYEES